jgi:hypothetical protein
MRFVSGQMICGVDALSLRHAFRRLRGFDFFFSENLAHDLSCSKTNT